MTSKTPFASMHALEERLRERSNALESLHMEAAIDAHLINVEKRNPFIGDLNADATSPTGKSNNNNDGEAIFDDYTNPNAVANCLSPYEPSSADRIEAFCDWVGLTSSDVLLDIGCGDGRVCVGASKVTGCKSVGLDVSPLCINMANQVANEEGQDGLCTFFEADATVDPDLLLSDSTPIGPLLDQVTVVFLYTYPTLLDKLLPLLKRLCAFESLRAIVTLRYHIPSAIVDREDTQNEFQLYTSMSPSWIHNAAKSCLVPLNPVDSIEMDC